MFSIWSGPNLDKKCVQLSNPASSYEILIIFFVVMPFKKGLNKGVVKLQVPFLFVK